MPGSDPQAGDIYKAHKEVFPLSDVHGESHRPIGVTHVDRTVGIGHALGRTTQRPSPSEMSIESAADETCGLTKTGWWTSRHQQPVLLRHYGTGDCRYAGTLSEPAKSALIDFYIRLKAVGL